MSKGPIFLNEKEYTVATESEIKVLSLDSFRDYLKIQNNSTDTILVYYSQGSAFGELVKPTSSYVMERAFVNDVYVKNLGNTNPASVYITTDGDLL